MYFYDALYKVAKSKGIAIESLSMALGKSPRYIGVGKSRGSSPSVDNAAKMFKVCGYSIIAVPDEEIPENALILTSKDDDD